MRPISEWFESDHVTAEQLDWLLAHGWRHFGKRFFRYDSNWTTDGFVSVLPLRIDLAWFRPSRSQMRVRKRNDSLDVVIRPASIDAEKEAIFVRHRGRFKENIPDSLRSFLSESPAEVPCTTVEICLFRAQRLLGVSYLDIGLTATSNVYSIYEPAESNHSLGVFLILQAIEYSIHLDKLHYYPGYAYEEPSHYDYKKRFAATEYFDWQGDWHALDQLGPVD